MTPKRSATFCPAWHPVARTILKDLVFLNQMPMLSASRFEHWAKTLVLSWPRRQYPALYANLVSTALLMGAQRWLGAAQLFALGTLGQPGRVAIKLAGSHAQLYEDARVLRRQVASIVRAEQGASRTNNVASRSSLRRTRAIVA